MNRRKFITQLTLSTIGLPFISTIINNDIQGNNFNCISLGNMAINTKDFFLEKGLSFDTSLSIENWSSTTLSSLFEYIDNVNSRILLIAKPSSVNESKVLFSLLSMLTNKHMESYTYIYLPFNFEGVKLQNEAEKLRLHFKNHVNVICISLTEVRQRYGHLKISEAFEKVYTKLYYDFIQK